MDSAEVGVLEEADKVGLGGLLEGGDSAGLEPEVTAETGRDFPDEPLERELPDEEVRRLLVLPESFLMRRSVDFWYFLISLRATVPGLNLCCFFAPWESTTGVDLRAALAPRDFLGVLPPVDFLAVCFVRAITE